MSEVTAIRSWENERIAAELETAAWAEIDLGALASNYAYVRRLVGPEVRIIPVLKANAYGHGAHAVARCLVECGADALAVASVEEGVALRQAGIMAPILLLEYMLASQARLVVAHRLTPTVHSEEVMEAIAQAAGEACKPVNIHLRVRTLGGSLGAEPDRWGGLLDALARSRSLRAAGIFTHLTAAYMGDDALTKEQLAQFRAAIRQSEHAGVRFPLVHAASSPAILKYPAAHLGAVRPGTMLYGLPSGEGQDMGELRPVMQLKARITHVEEQEGPFLGYRDKASGEAGRRVATIAAGYAQARFLLTTKDGEVLVHGRRAPIIGGARMAGLMVDVTHIPQVRPGDEAVLFGRQGDEEISAAEVAAKAGIPIVNCESVCLLGSEVPRIYAACEGELPCSAGM